MKILSLADDDPAYREDQPSLSQLKSGRWFPIFHDLHANWRLQGTDIRGEESPQEIDRDYPRDEEGAESGE